MSQPPHSLLILHSGPFVPSAILNHQSSGSWTNPKNDPTVKSSMQFDDNIIVCEMICVLHYTVELLYGLMCVLTDHEEGSMNMTSNVKSKMIFFKDAEVILITMVPGYQ
ncbi:hypothetical protein VNO77_01580 [Canavalia gladiata]|uniref:Uncharacterized protein n=1 Tax=Canavalia gladiata TaxID=3824 RepID=A0AAN9MXY0_CANGL